ncbi:murein transglycosylase [Fusarium odoratissimum NRRL 54006]|uniref:Murein transglycosylase n=1 Tax=Fusarium odoratissimum (strain NRRL 54006) TaxID=1089451 RepID=X0JUJ3_FUSO5|nr:murein transglycosylase [Fusarium odoratissimum NRRL 54006]EXM04954.1 murein transglycosylase [Fusarium odoratissimum NRRL 54006]
MIVFEIRTSAFITAAAVLTTSVNAWLPNTEPHALNERDNETFVYPLRTEPNNKRWLPATKKIRGVNLGSLFIYEPWIDSQEWANTGCEGEKSDFDCVMNKGQDITDKNFQAHWKRWINQTDLDEMLSYGLNTIRVPLGYWLKEDLVDDSEHFPKLTFGGWFGILDSTLWLGKRSRLLHHSLNKFIAYANCKNSLHGVPGAQESNQPFTGQYAPTVGFYSDYNYGRAIEWLEWMTDIIHTKKEYRNVGMLGLVNEPLNWDKAVDSLRKTYYPKACSAIRKVEDKLKVTSNNRLHIHMMGSLWGSGKPTEFLRDTSFTAFDDHRYLKWDTSVEASHGAYIKKSCSDDRNTDGPTIVGEWSLAVPDDVEKTDAWNPQTQKEFYTKWFSAQVHAYEENTLGWVFWTWEASLGDDYRWSYRDAARAGVIPKDLDSLPSVC